MMKAIAVLAALIASAILAAGCCNLAGGPEPVTNYTPSGNAGSGAAAAWGGQQANASGGEGNGTGGGTSLQQNATNGSSQQQPPDEPAGAQEDCATMTPTCAACLAKPGCGWCKASNSCFAGNRSGPAVSSCPAAEWTTTESGCAAPAGGSSCAKQTNCASCLSGSGCKWCIQGSRCADASAQESCLGGWLTASYQCNYASR
jgi:hypothetical protein